MNWQSNPNTNSGVTYYYTYDPPIGFTPNAIQVFKETPPGNVGDEQAVAQAIPQFNPTNTKLQSGIIRVHPSVANSVAVLEAMAHEIGHFYGLNECPDCCPNSSAMTLPPYSCPIPCNDSNYYNDTTQGTAGPSNCDASEAQRAGNYNPGTECPDADGDGVSTCAGDCNDYNPHVAYNCDGGSCFCDEPQNINYCQQRQAECEGNADRWMPCTGQCLPSPVLIDTDGDGFDLTSAADGVNFDMNDDGTAEKLAWTAAGSDDAWLALDRNDNGTIDNGQEVFGNRTPQPAPAVGESKNGFLALAVHDDTANGGNGDGVIDRRDTIFTSLRLWQDVNHNGTSESDELHTLAELGLGSIDLSYRESKRTDQHGNQFRYRAKVKDVRGAQVGRWAWDVFLQSAR